MKKFRNIRVLLGMALLGGTMYAQNGKIAYYNEAGLPSVNAFETTKTDTVAYDGMKVKIGGAFALQFQGLEQKTASDVALLDLSTGFNLAAANFDIDVQLADGVRMNLVTYLSSRHHREAWVKGGYIQFDKLPFIKSEVVDKLMENLTIKIGHMEINYGDAHFRRTDNGNAILNPFVGNLILDGFATEVGGEIYYKGDSGLLAMVAISDGQLSPSVTTHGTDPSLYFKLGFDKQLTEDLRTRLTASYYSTNKTARNTLYAGDRTGSRYYYVMLPEDAATGESNHTTGRLNPGFNNKVQAIMVNPFVKYKGLEFFGTAEFSNGKSVAEDDTRSVTQLAGELIYRFGNTENFYFGGKYNTVSAELMGFDDKVKVNRFQLGAGWFMTNNIMAKVEYVNQQYKDYPTGNLFEGGEFKGFMIEAVIAF